MDRYSCLTEYVQFMHSMALSQKSVRTRRLNSTECEGHDQYNTQLTCITSLVAHSKKKILGSNILW